ncbi:MAG: hypothetical protein IJZ38_13040 [Bacteroides sp.]|nr:hypothetical protein [Bacteroides sp.]
MLERNIVIVDDNKRVSTVHIPAYLGAINKMKKDSEKWKNYEFKLHHFSSMRAAQEYMEDKKNCIDVLVVDFDFKGEKTFASGAAFVKYVRNNLNRYCQIVFYTMQGITCIEKEDLVDLINSDVFKILDKSVSKLEVAQTLFEAATLRNPMVESLEYFYTRYSSLLQSYEYSFSGQMMTFDEIIGHIRMDDDIGRRFVNKLLQKAILREIKM